MNSLSTAPLDAEQLAAGLAELFQTAERPLVAAVHELLMQAVYGRIVHARFSDDHGAIDLTLTELESTSTRTNGRAKKSESSRLELRRSGVTLRVMCDRLARICRKRDGSIPNVYDDIGVVPQSAIENLLTLHESNPLADYAFVTDDRLIEVEYHNDKRRPIEFTIKPAVN